MSNLNEEDIAEIVENGFKTITSINENAFAEERNNPDGNNRTIFVEGKWYKLVPIDPKTQTYVECGAFSVDEKRLFTEYEFLINELMNKEAELSQLKEQYNDKEFEIVYQSDIDFKGLYGSTSEKVRKQHAKTVLSDLDSHISSLELSINWIKQYIPFIREVIRCK